MKRTHLKDAGHEVLNPALDVDKFDLAVRTAQTEYDQNKPDVIELLTNSGLPLVTLIEVGDDHRFADKESLGEMLVACE